ncbi:MAG: glycosyltransferase family 9 protein [bacterium]
MKVIINRTDAIGDTVLTLPMAQAIKENYPGAEVIFLVSAKSADMFAGHPFVDDIQVFDARQSPYRKLRKLFRFFRKVKADAYFHVGGSFYPTYVAWITKVPFRGGLVSRWLSFLYLNKGLRQKRSLASMHESDYNLELLRPFGIEPKENQRKLFGPALSVSPAEKKQAMTTFLEEHSITSDKPMIFIHPGMTGHTLNWASRNYARLIERIEKRHPNHFLFVVSHTPSDGPYLLGLKDQLNNTKFDALKTNLVFFDGSKKGLRHYMGVLSHACCFIGPSTGTTHIANALGVHMLGLYSPIKVQSARRWSPVIRDERTKIIVPDVVCGEQLKCAGDTCPYYECMAKVEVEDVYQEFVRLIPDIAKGESAREPVA